MAEKGAHEKALVELGVAIRMDPKDAEAYFLRGTTRLQMNDCYEAINDLNKAIDLNPTHFIAFYNRARAEIGLKQFDRAIKDLALAIQINGSNVNSLVAEAWLLATCDDAQLRDGAKAIMLSKRACELTKWKNANALSTLGMAYAEQGDFDQAIFWEQKALKDSSCCSYTRSKKGILARVVSRKEALSK